MNKDFLVAILAGGKSRRMGFDKAQAELDGVTFLARTARAAKESGQAVVVAGRAKPSGWEGDDVAFLEDKWPEMGPMGGVATALRHAGGPVLAIACDMPYLTPSAIQWLQDESDAQSLAHGLVTVNNGQYEPLFSIYTQSCIPLMEARLASRDLSLQALIRDGQFAQAVAPDWVAQQLVNINTPADLAGLGKWENPHGC